jgi:NAD(P)H-flavin reductase
MTRPFGPGFRLERALGRRLVCCVAGTGIAAVRPVLAELATTRTTLAGVRLYYGVRTRAHVAFREDLEAWAARGLTVRLCLSRERPAEAWDRAGRVPAVLSTEETNLADAAIVLAGPRDMGPLVEAVATAAGMPAERLLMNF